MLYEHSNEKPENITENWPGKWKVFSWLEFISAIPQVLFLVTSVKENGKPNLAFQSWSTFTGEGNDFFILMSGVMKHTHTYANIKREKEFCVNFISDQYIANCWKSIHDHKFEENEIVSSGFTEEKSKTINAPGIKECFLKMEFEYVWEKELINNGTNMTICGKLKYIIVDESFVTAPTNKKYTDNTFMFHLHNPINPVTGEYLGGGVGTIQYKHEM